jgi:acyl-coenzyme A thioesterase PaaI-like protein
MNDHHRRLEAMYAAAPINHVVPSRVRVAEGSAEVFLKAGPELWHAGGALHGSIYFKALDDAAFFAANSVVPEAFVLTASFEVQLRAKVTARELRAEGRLDGREGRKLRASATLYAGEEVVAEGRGLFVASDTPLSEVPSYRGDGEA